MSIFFFPIVQRNFVNKVYYHLCGKKKKGLGIEWSLQNQQKEEEVGLRDTKGFDYYYY